MSRLVRIHGAKPLQVLWALFDSDSNELDMEIDPETGLAVTRWEGGPFGGRGLVSYQAPLLNDEELELVERGELPAPSLEDDPGSHIRLALLRIPRDPMMGVRARALLEVSAFELHGERGAFCLERAVELLHGPRDQKRSHRERQTPRFAELATLLSRAHFVIDGSQKRILKPARRDTGHYTGTVSGPLLRFEGHSRRFCTVWVNQGLYGLMTSERSVAYSEVRADIFRVDIKGHTNPHGNRPSRARRVKARLGCVTFARARENKAKDGKLSRVSVEELLGRWSRIPAQKVASAGRMAAYVDCLQEDLAHVAACGGPVLIDPIERARRPGQSWVCLRLSSTAQKNVADRRAKYRRHDRAQSRPPVEATRSGSAGSHAPP